MSLPTMYLEDPNGFLRRWTPPLSFQRANDMHMLLVDMLEANALPEQYKRRAQGILRSIVDDNSK